MLRRRKKETTICGKTLSCVRWYEFSRSFNSLFSFPIFFSSFLSLSFFLLISYILPSFPPQKVFLQVHNSLTLTHSIVHTLFPTSTGNWDGRSNEWERESQVCSTRKKGTRKEKEKRLPWKCESHSSLFSHDELLSHSHFLSHLMSKWFGCSRRQEKSILHILVQVMNKNDDDAPLLTKFFGFSGYPCCQNMRKKFY